MTYCSPWSLSAPSRGQAAAERGRVADVDAGVDLADGPLRVGGVPLLDDRAHRPSSSRTMRPSPVGSSTSAVRTVSTLPARAVGRDERGDGRRAQQGGVAVDQQDRPVQIGDGGEGDGGGVPGAVLLVLDDGQRRRGDLAPGAPRRPPGPSPPRRRWPRPAGARPRRARGRAGCARPGCAGPWAWPTACGCPARRRGRRRRPGPLARRRAPMVPAGSRISSDGDRCVCWGTRTRTETARLQRPAGCRLPHPPPATRVAAQAPPRDGARPEPRAARPRACTGTGRGAPGDAGSSRRPPYGGVGYGYVARVHDGRRPRAEAAPAAPGDTLVRTHAHPAHRATPARRPERRPAGERARQGEGRDGADRSLRLRDRALPRAGRDRPGRLGLGAVLARRGPGRRLLLLDAARRHRRATTATSPTGRSRRSGRCG